MATLVFTALGTAIGGPLGGAIGSLIGNQIDRAIGGGPKREGPRLKELSVSTSSYGTPIPHHHGRVRAPGSIIWATDLVERSSTSGGGKGSPSTTTFSYSVSCAVALASRPIVGIGRIWADGNLLRGAAGDLKVGGTLRTYTGHGDQAPDPLIASAQGNTPAFRGLAYCVFEDLILTDFGNRIPALTFEIIADTQSVTIEAVAGPLEGPVTLVRPLDGLLGYSNEGGTLADTLAAIDQLYPIACDASGASLSLIQGDALPITAPLLPEAAAAGDGESFAEATGQLRRRKADASAVPDGLRYYDVERDFQAGMQRADGRARPGRSRIIEFPGALAASDARSLANGAATRAAWSRDTIAWRMAELDPSLTPGQVVYVPGREGIWSIESWEWRDQGVELELRRVPRGPGRQPLADPGQVLTANDELATPSLLAAYEAPWDGVGSADLRHAFAAASSQSAGWRGAALYLVQAGQLLPIGNAGRQRSIIGLTVTPLAPSTAAVLEREAVIEIELAAADFALNGSNPEALASGANRALIGGEVVQFACAERLAGNRWRLAGLLRGRGGTESAALAGSAPGTAFILLDNHPVLLDPAVLGAPGPATIAAIGLADPAPVLTELLNPGLTQRPLTPVHGRVREEGDGSLALAWCRRARGAWAWQDGVDVPLIEQAEGYTVGVGGPSAPALIWETTEPRLTIAEPVWTAIRTAHPGKPLWVRQIGTAALSNPLLLLTIS